MKDHQFKFNWHDDDLVAKGSYVRIGRMGYFQIVDSEDEAERFSCGGSTLEKAKIEAEIVILDDMFEGLFKTYEETSCITKENSVK